MLSINVAVLCVTHASFVMVGNSSIDIISSNSKDEYLFVYQVLNS